MQSKDTKRLSRLTAILTQLQTKRIVSATELSQRFGVSTRTIYRDIKALEEAGVPILSEEGKGYSLMEDYRLPPVMFTEEEANALMTAQQIIETNKDASLVKAYQQAISKIKAVLKNNTKDKANLLDHRMQVRQYQNHAKTSNYLVTLQLAITNYTLLKIHYQAASDEAITTRTIEPFAIYSTQENWLLIAYCRLRFAFRVFRLDRIKQLITLKEGFKPHQITLSQYFEMCKEKYSQNP
ncbi:MAG: YafY family transcriptional regulator [Cytophagales bacterium]|nr:MAG: YafY family transcriptional regulator [Cytophagales bacterium]TAF60009.1 MAG: YafY family transcriptional regulator [Cytophagales bacterium]